MSSWVPTVFVAHAAIEGLTGVAVLLKPALMASMAVEGTGGTRDGLDAKLARRVPALRLACRLFGAAIVALGVVSLLLRDEPAGRVRSSVAAGFLIYHVSVSAVMAALPNTEFKFAGLPIHGLFTALFGAILGGFLQ